MTQINYMDILGCGRDKDIVRKRDRIRRLAEELIPALEQCFIDKDNLT